MKIGVIQSSLNKDSKTAILAKKCATYLEAAGVDFEYIDLRSFTLPHCDGSSLEEYNSADLHTLHDVLSGCTHFIIGMPVYQYSFSGVLKNFLDILGDTFKNKPFGIMENSGSVRAYLSASDLVTCSFFEFGAIPVPPVVHTWAGDFEDGEITNDHIQDKIEQLVDNLKRIS